MKPGDLVFWDDTQFGNHRLWRIDSVLLGAMRQESVVRLVSLSENPACDENGELQPSLLVPECLIRGMIYAKEPTVQAAQPKITRGDQRRFSEYLASLAATEAAKIEHLREHGDGSMVASAQDLAFGCLVVSAHLAGLADGENGE